MGNGQSNKDQLNCRRCDINLPTSDLHRNQYIEGTEYVVFNFTSDDKYFQFVKSPNMYVCSPCFFNAFRDLYDRSREEISKQNDNTFQITFENEWKTLVEEDVRAHITAIVQHTDLTRDLIDMPVDHVDSFEDSNHSIDRICLGQLTKQTWYEATAVTDISLQRWQDHLRTLPPGTIYKVVWYLMYIYLYSRCTYIHFLTKVSYGFMVLSKEYLRTIVACPQNPVYLNNFKDELFTKSKRDLAWFRLLLIDVYIHINNVTLDNRLIISHYLSCILKQCLDELTSKQEQVSFTMCITKTVIAHSLCGEDVREDECVLYFIKTMLQITISQNTAWRTECKHLYIREKLRLLKLQEFSQHFYLIYSSNLWDVENIDDIMDIIFQEKQTNNRIYIFNLIKVHGISPSSDTLTKLKEYTNIKDMLNIMANDESEIPLIIIFEQLRNNGYSLELLNNVKFILFEVRNVFDKICKSNISSRKYLEQKVETYTKSLSEHGDCKRFVNVLASVVCGVHHLIGYRPRDVQLISCILILLSDEQQNRLLQIRTGEGKSCVIAMLAISLALLRPDKTIDIVTTSSLLAERDFREWQELYKFFGVSYASNSNWSLENDKKKCYQNTVIIGTVETFSADHLRHDFQQKGIRGTRQFQIAIVDEVDSMLLDKGIQFTYLSEDIPAMRHLEPLLAMIWYRVCQFKKTITVEGNCFFQGGQLAFYQVFMNLINSNTTTPATSNSQVQTLFRHAEERNILPSGFAKNMQSAMTSPNIYPQYIAEIVDEKVIQFFRLCEKYSNVRFILHNKKNDIQGQVICEAISPNEEVLQTGEVTVNVMLLGKGKVCELHNFNLTELRNLIRETVLSQVEFEDSGIETEKFPIPSYFQDLVNSQIPVWICNAIDALEMQPEREYIIKEDLIFPIDYRFTGMIESNKKWGDGLQQFLEMKHSLSLSPMSIITNFISNISFFQKYNHIYGATGTLGSEADRDFLRKMYNVSHHSIPAYMRNKMFENKGIVLNTKREWMTEICETLNSEILSRAVLVICEDIKTSEELRHEIENNCKIKKLSLYTRNETEEETVVQKTLGTGEIVLATNLAGRGTDIKVSDEVNDNGGLFVIITFLPMNERVELQAKGRTARGGKPGSTKMIVVRNNKLQKSLPNLRSINDLMRYRNQIEHRGMIILEEEVKEVLKKDDMFNKYCTFLKQILKKQNVSTKKKILQEILHEKWGIWLKINSTNEPFDKLQIELEYDIATILSGKPIKGNVYIMIKMGNNLMMLNKYKEAIEHYDNVINFRKRWSALAYYNKAFCLLKRRSKDNIKKAITHLKEASSQLQTYFHETTVTLACFQNSVVERPKDENFNLFVDQSQVRIQILTFFQETIEQLIAELEVIGRTKIIYSGTLKRRPILSLLGDFRHASSGTCKSVGQELKCLWQMGMLQLYAIDKIPWYKSDQFFLCVIGISQIAIGVLLLQVSCGTLLPISTGLIGEGISDILGCTGFVDPVREFSWKKWGLKKGLSLALICLVPIATHYGKIGHVGLKVSGGYNIRGVRGAFKIVTSTVVVDAKTVKTIFTTKIPLNVVKKGLKCSAKIIVKTFMSQVASKVGKEYFDSCVMDTSMEIIHNQLEGSISSEVETLLKSNIIIRSTVEIFLSEKRELASNDAVWIQIQTIFTDFMKERMKQWAKNIEWQRNTMGKVLNIINWAPLNVKMPNSKAKFILKLLSDCRNLINSKCINASINTAMETYSLQKEIRELFNEFEREFSMKAYTSITDDMMQKAERFLLDRCAPEFTNIICDGIVSIIQEPLSEVCFNLTSSAVHSILNNSFKDDSDTFVKTVNSDPNSAAECGNTELVTKEGTTGNE